MKILLKAIALAAVIALAFTRVSAEPARGSTNRVHKVVFEVAIDGVENWEGALRNVENVQRSLGAKSTRIAVVAHGKGIGMLLAKTAAVNSQVRKTVEKLHADGVTFAACENTMKKMGVTREQIVRLATTVDSGVSEVILKQEDGYAYIKSGG